MGSGALKNYNPIRVTQETREWLSPTLVQILHEINSGYRIGEVPAYRSKQSFGDLDFVVESGWFSMADPIVKFATQVGPVSGPIIVRNGGVNSIGVWLGDTKVAQPGIFQVDLISAPTDRYDFTMSYLSWNDVGNLVGRIARRADLKFGHDGLWYSVRQGTRLFEEVLITLDFTKALMFLGFDPLWWKDGFDEIKSIHEFVRSSRYMTSQAFFARNQRDRYRDEKRPVYGSFVQGLETDPPKDGEPIPSEDPERYDWVVGYFPEAKGAIDDALERARLRVEARDKFTATMVMRLTGITGPPLGEVMTAIRGQWDDQPAMDRALVKMSNEEIETMILTFFKKVHPNGV